MSNNIVIEQKYYPRPDDDTLKYKLTALQYNVTQNQERELSFRNLYWDHFDAGIYVDITTGEPLFLSVDKFDSRRGYPSFTKPINNTVVYYEQDNRFNILRTAVFSRCGQAYLGSVFNDGPKDKGGLRYCINSAALLFIPLNEMVEKGYGYLRCLVDTSISNEELFI